MTFSIILGDIDQFKDIHSKLGSLGANNIIIQVAGSIVKECRKVDTVGHWGDRSFHGHRSRNSFFGCCKAG